MTGTKGSLCIALSISVIWFVLCAFITKPVEEKTYYGLLQNNDYIKVLNHCDMATRNRNLTNNKRKELDKVAELKRIAEEKRQAEERAKQQQELARLQQQATPPQVVDEQTAKDYISYRESRHNYNAVNGRYRGRWQLDESYLNGDFSPENQDATAERYVAERYGSWSNAYNFWQANGWY